MLKKYCRIANHRRLMKEDKTTSVPDAETNLVPGDRLAFATIGVVLQGLSG